MNVVLTPQPTPCRDCFCMLQATSAEENDGCCSACGAEACYCCGCTNERACVRTILSINGQHSTTSRCSWAAPGLCSFCHEEAAYVLYMLVTDRVPSDGDYLRTYVPGQTHHLEANR